MPKAGEKKQRQYDADFAKPMTRWCATRNPTQDAPVDDVSLRRVTRKNTIVFATGNNGSATKIVSAIDGKDGQLVKTHLGDSIP